jgi:hypothetical protein
MFGNILKDVKPTLDQYNLERFRKNLKELSQQVSNID